MQSNRFHYGALKLRYVCFSSVFKMEKLSYFSLKMYLILIFYAMCRSDFCAVLITYSLPCCYVDRKLTVIKAKILEAT